MRLFRELRNFSLRVFQFQYGTIMRSSLSISCSFFIFISIPVWYDYEPLLKRSAAVLNHFNSSMVRLWVCFSSSSSKSILISIPVWYDYERLEKIAMALPSTFQFQYGTIMRLMQENIRGVKPNFNSSMVRLWVWTDKSRGLYIQISIPVWYDYEGGQKYRAKWFGGFQFQYGTIMR